MCAKRCTLSEMLDSGTWKEIAMGDLQVYYDPELYGAKIAVNDDNGRLISNTIIGVNTVMEVTIRTNEKVYIASELITDV